MPAFIRLHDWPILARLAFGFGLTLLLLCAMALLGLVGLHQTQTLQTTLGQTLATQHRGEQVRALLTLDLVKSQAIIRSVGMPEVADRFKPELLSADKDTTQQLDALKQVDQPDIAKAAQELQRQHRDYLNTRNQVLALVESGQTIQATEKENAVLTPAATAMTKQQAELTRRVNAETERAQSQVARLTKTISALIASLAFCAFAIGLLCAWKIAQSVNLPVQMAVSASQAIAEGKLYLDVPTPQRQDELGHLLQSMKHMRDHLVQVTSQVRDRSEGVATSSAEVATGAQRLSASTHSHTSALNQSRSALERIETEIGHNLDQARQACALAGTAREAAQSGAQAMMQVIDQMRGIHESSQRVTDIISVIDGIAFQTNILALNAAVEAARAGEEGRGFAVVAAEVRTLAQRSANAAREIKQLITASTERVTAGATIVDQTGATIVSLQNTIDEVVALIHSLNDASTRHAAGISDVRQTVVALDAASIDNMSLMTQSAAAAADLQNQAAHLLQAVSAFELTRH